MSDSHYPVISQSVARHTAQYILRSAIDAGSGYHFGLIGRTKSSTIDNATPLTPTGTEKVGDILSNNCDLQHTVENWRNQGVDPCGIYFISGSDENPGLSTMLQNEKDFRRCFPEEEACPIIHMPLMLNTVGCLEAFAYIITDDSVQLVPLLLEEDGQENMKR